MKRLFVFSLFSLLVSIEAGAEDCRREALEAKEAGIHGLVISFEGLASHAVGFVRNGLMRDLPSNLVSKNFAYTRAQDAYECVEGFRAVLGGKLNLYVVGHSFGAGIAVPDFLQKFPKNFVIKGVITLDPRSWSSDSTYRKSNDLFVFHKNTNLKIHAWVNYFQRGKMPGYKVKGAINIPLRGVRHVAIPKDPSVRNTLLELIQTRQEQN